MGENDITLSPGALFIKHPDDQDWQPLVVVLDGSVEYHEAPEDVPEVVKRPELVEMAAQLTIDPECWTRLCEIMTTALQPFVEAFADIRRKLAESIPTMCNALYEMVGGTWFCAYAWATVHRPKWVNILNRTKKRRTRKKYQDRIMRAYQKEVNT